ncbi:helix-turn-helix transcriptional regulator [Spongiactinospora sp. TRM90649]|uniref:helix-turn-helix domain-containing protein n=1 Tax=Spongiactinospora sp. TRM90649 TaxID=3031114 RepID=UPI0023FA0BF1|nr:helix-turn-helix transcriptional regulator [Spongiactinospora sp. TRM90649]MDF5754674.1 helix-turn-helix transcriptional regulator [Spongiactinospora sp. TRM90649]
MPKSALAIRLAYERRERGWQQKELARRLAHTGRELGLALPHRDSIIRRVKDWEAGRHRPRDPYPMLYARVLGIDEAELFCEETPPVAPEKEGAELSWVWEPCATSQAIYEMTMHEDRRKAIKALSVTVGLPLIDPAQRWLTAVIQDLPDSTTPGRVGMDEVAQLEMTAEVFRTWGHTNGGGLARKAVIGQLNEVADLIRESHPRAIALRLYGVMARLAKTAANMSWDSGMQRAAQRYYVLGLQAGRVSGDRGFGAGVLASMARQLMYLKEPGDALELVRLALDGTRASGAGRLQAMLHTREAWAYAGLGRIEAFRRATGAAEDAYAAGDDGPEWQTSFDAAELAGVTGGRYLDLAREVNPRFAIDAVTYIQRAIELRAQPLGRSFALDHAGLAHAHIINGDLDAAVTAADAAVQAAGRTTSDRVRDQLGGLVHALADQNAPGVADLRERIRVAMGG